VARTVGAIVARVVERYRPGDQLDGLKRIGVDELSYRRHHEYITVVIDHELERVVWAHPGKSAETLGRFFKELGPERCQKLESVTMDMSPAYVKARDGSCAPGTGDLRPLSRPAPGA
jgi:transposase